MIPLILAVFGGFAADEASYLSGKDQICQPIATGADGGATGAPACHKGDRKDVQAASYAKPSRGRKLPDGRTLVAQVGDDGKVTISADDQTLVRWAPPKPAHAVNGNLYVSPSGSLLGVEVDGDTVVFDVSGARRQPQAPQPAVPAKGGGGGNAFDRAVSKGGVWEQRIVPCDQAGVLLKLDKKKKKFALTITTKCQGDKNVTDLDGAWTTEGNDQLALTFENEDAPAETMQCHFSVCEDAHAEDCLTCTQEDVTFTLQVVRR